MCIPRCRFLTSAECRHRIVSGMRASLLLKAIPLLLLIALCWPAPQGTVAGELRGNKTKDERRVTLQVTDVPLNEVLSILAKSVPLEIRGTVIPSQERITAQFSNVTLEEALARIMRGYNYVLVRPEESARPLLVVMNKIERSIQKEPVPARPATPGTAPAGGPIPAASPPRETPPAQPGRPAPGAVPGPPTQGGQAAGPVQQFPGMAGGPPAPLPPGMPGGQAGPASVAGNPPPATPPPAQSQQAGQPQQPAQANPEPSRIMTPFGERVAE